MNKKFIPIALLLLVVILEGLSSCIFTSAKDVEYIPVQQTDGGAWYFINAKGERIGNQQWEFQPSVTIDGIFTARTDSGISVFRWDGKEARPIDSLTNLVSVGVYNEGLLPVTPSMQRIRVVDKKGDVKFVLEPIDGNEISSCAGIVKDDMLVVTTIDGKAGVVNAKGEVVVKPTYSDISNFSDGYALAVNYDYDNYENGPTYYVIDKKGNVKKVAGKFGYEEGECASVPAFVNGEVRVPGPWNEDSSEPEYFVINTEGQVKKAGEVSGWSETLENGGKISYKYQDEVSAYTWTDKEGKTVLATKELGTSLSACGKFVVLSSEKETKVYDENGQEIAKFAGQYYGGWPGGDFGLILRKYDYQSDVTSYILLDDKGQKVDMPNVYGVGTDKTLPNDSGEDEIDCGGYYVTSAYVDIPAAAGKLASMITSGSVKGKSTYYIGESVKDILEGQNINFMSGRNFSIPTDSNVYYLATGAGFTINGEGTASADVVAPTYQNYFEVHHYDYWGRAWGWNRKRQVGVHLNANAKVVSFDIKLRTNHPSGMILREAIGKRLKKDGFTLINSGDNYDEYDNGYRTAIVYGTEDTNGVGVVIADSKTLRLSAAEKASLATRL